MPKGPFVTAAVLMLIGLALAIGGLRLITLGGSWYYLLAGLGLIASGAMMWRGMARGVTLYWVVLGATVIWSLYEVGLDGWALAPRLAAPAVIGLWLTMPWVGAKLDYPKHDESPTQLLVRMHITTTAVAIGFMVFVLITVRVTHAPISTPIAGLTEEATDWPQVGRDILGLRFASPTQINPGNVAALHQAWTYHTGLNEPTFEATPILAGGQLVFCTAHDVVIALDPETGEQRWRYDAKAEAAGNARPACRGVGHWVDANAHGACADRVYVATLDARLIALDAATGGPCVHFGRDGIVSLTQGLGEVQPGAYFSTSPPLAVGDVVIVGAARSSVGATTPSGVVRAFDAETGALRWAWDMGRPDRGGAPPANQTYTQGTPNAWSLFSADPALGLVYLPLGNAAPDYWGGRRRDFDEHHSSAIVALDLRTGAPRWWFQTTHHDLWNYDVSAQPVLVDIPEAEGVRHALVQATKRGEIFVLDRATGAPILPVDERPAPQGAAPGDRVAPTQPHSGASLTPPALTERAMWGMTPIDQMLCRMSFRELRYEGAFTPPGLTPSLRFPGEFGAMDWGGVSVDPAHGLLIANTSALADVAESTPQADAPDGAPFTIRTRPFLSRLFVPCTAPPWGKLSALELSTGRVIWSHPLGTAYDSGPHFWRSRLPIPMGMPNAGGAITTRSGLIFIAASVDHYLRAFDTHSGVELWRGRLPAAGHATPMTYVTRSGRQFVVIAAGGHAALGPALGDAVIAYSLPGNLIQSRDSPAN